MNKKRWLLSISVVLCVLIVFVAGKNFLNDYRQKQNSDYTYTKEEVKFEKNQLLIGYNDNTSAKKIKEIESKYKLERIGFDDGIVLYKIKTQKVLSTKELDQEVNMINKAENKSVMVVMPNEINEK